MYVGYCAIPLTRQSALDDHVRHARALQRDRRRQPARARAPITTAPTASRHHTTPASTADDLVASRADADERDRASRTVPRSDRDRRARRAAASSSDAHSGVGLLPAVEPLVHRLGVLQQSRGRPGTRCALRRRSRSRCRSPPSSSVSSTSSLVTARSGQPVHARGVAHHDARRTSRSGADARSSRRTRCRACAPASASARRTRSAAGRRRRASCTPSPRRAPTWSAVGAMPDADRGTADRWCCCDVTYGYVP